MFGDALGRARMARLAQVDLLGLPKCPHCGVANPALEKKFECYYRGVASDKTRDWSIYFCRSCGLLVAAGGPHGTGGVVDIIIPQSRSLDLAIPERPRRYLQEALDTLHAPSASIMVSASAVDALLKDCGLTKGSLYNRIDQAAKSHLITTGMAEWAHEVRLDANDERHADEHAVAPNSSDAQRCFDFALAVAEYLFVLPAKVARGRAKPSAPNPGTSADG